MIKYFFKKLTAFRSSLESFINFSLHFYLLFFLITSTNTLYAQITFQKTFGGDSSDYGGGIAQTIDDGYVITGYTKSFGAGDFDIYMVKTDSLGALQWSKTFGGSLTEMSDKIQQTLDGGYIIIGYTNSFGMGSTDAYLLKINNSGSLQWSKTYGGSSTDEGADLHQTVDGGYIITGYTSSFGAGTYDVYLFKADSLGVLQWTKTFGGNNWDFGTSVQQTTDGGYIVTGYTKSFGSGLDDIYLLKTDMAGLVQWSKTFGGIDDEYSQNVHQTNDGGYIIVGTTYSFGAGAGDVYLLKTDSSGALQWSKTYGGSSNDFGLNVNQTSDNGYVINGKTQSFGAGASDVFLLKTDSTGSLQWSKTFGGVGDDASYFLQQTIDGGYIMTGNTDNFAAGPGNIYMLKTDSNGDIGCNENIAPTVTNVPTTIAASAATVTGTGGSENTPFTVTLNPATIDSTIYCEPVWPGDANADLVANHYDMLSVGLHYAETGPPRNASYQSIVWKKLPAEKWSLPVQKNGKDRKHVDCDGNGVINSQDILAIEKNFEMTHAKTIINSYNIINPDLYFEVLTPNVAPGTEVEVKIMAGKDSISLYGIAYEIQLDPSLIEKTNMSITWSNSWLGQQSVNLLTFDTIFPSSGQIFASSVRNNHTDVKAYGEIARMYFKIRTDTIFSDTIDLNMSISTTSDGAVTANGDTITFNTSKDTIIVNPTAIVEKHLYDLPSLKVYPVPAKGIFTMLLPDANKNYEITLCNTIGQILFHNHITGKTEEVLDFQKFPEGIYFINISSEDTIYHQKLVLINAR